jgi:hypothetical protein
MTRRPQSVSYQCVLLAVLMLAAGGAAASDSAAEMSVKAAIVHKIAKFVSWPDARFATSQKPLRFCVLGDSMTLKAFEHLSDRSIHGRPTRVLPAPEPSAVSSSCDVLYLNGAHQQSAEAWIESVKGQPVLTFGDAGEFGGHGSIVTILVRRNKVRFSIDLDANKNTGLRISAQLLQLAATVDGSGS